MYQTVAEMPEYIKQANSCMDDEKYMEEHIMSKVSESLLRGAQEALVYAKGNKKSSKTYQIKIPEKINVSAIREKLNMSQEVFAANFGLKKRTVEKWEQSQRKPTDAARAYLTVIARAPDAVRLALSGGKKVSHKPG